MVRFLGYCGPKVCGIVPVTFFLLGCFYSATQLALRVQQERTQVVCSNKEAQKRLTESNGTPAMDLGHMNVVLK